MPSYVSKTSEAVSAGDMVIPVSEIVNLLQLKLTESEINDLLNSLLARTERQVRPGDLITANLMNQVLAEIANLQQRVAGLEKTGSETKKTEITDLLPSGTKRIGDTVHIIGQGFDASGGTNVLVGSVQVVPSFGSDRDKELIITIPNIEVGSGGRVVTLFVSNLNGTDTMDFQVYPGLPTIPEGQLFVSLVSGPSGNLNAPGSYIFKYLVRGIVNLAERYTLEANTTAGWQTDIVNASGVVIVDPKLDLPSAPAPDGATEHVFVQVKIPDPPGSTTAQLRLTVKSTRNVALIGSSGGEELNVDAPAPEPEPITVQYEKIAATDPNTQPSSFYVGGVVKIPAGAGKYRMALNAKGCTPGVAYTRKIDALSDAKWTASFRRTTSMMSEPFTAQSDTMETFYLFINAESGAPAMDLVVRISAGANASDKGHLNQPIAVL